MKLKISSFLWGIVFLFSVSLFINARTSDSFFEISKNMEVFVNIFKELNTYYVDPIEPGKLTKTAIDAMLSELDPYTNYITESDIEDYEFMTTGKYGGIGAALRKKDSSVFVGELYEGSPAQKSGLNTGDQLIKIDQKDIGNKSIEDISILLKGGKGTKVVVRVKDAYTGTIVDKTIERGEIEVSSVPYAGYVGIQNNIAYVKLTQFTQNCGTLVRRALDSLKTSKPDIKGVVLDLRGNPGGLLDEAVSVCNIFIKQGQLVVSTKGKDKNWDKNFNTEGSPWDTQIPVTVLINGASASASEIVAGTLQDLDRGVVVGSKSFGKGLVQTTRPIGFNARLKLTTAKYYTPSGRCIQAIDYSHRDKNGNAEKFSDSMIATFKTQNGRLVKSGGGVSPDFKTNDGKLSLIASTLYTKNFLFDYATVYAKQHKSISSANSFFITDNDFNTFTNWISDKDYSYKKASEIILDSLQSALKEDKVYDIAKNDLTALKAKLAHDKKQDLQKNKEEIKQLLENEIVSRYYFQKGRIIQSLQKDSSINQAVNIILKQDQYRSILKSH